MAKKRDCSQTLKKDGVVKGRVKKPKQISKKVRANNKAARRALGTGEIASEEQKRKLQRDLRTLYVRFKRGAPADEKAIREILHPDIKFVRIPRQCQNHIRYAFVEFGSESQCDEAKRQIGQNPEITGTVYVDYVGVKSKHANKPKELQGEGVKRSINLTKLFVSGLVDGLTEDKLHQLFPKSKSASVSKRKGSSCGFVQFGNAGDAKAAFEASQKLILSRKGIEGAGHQLTVVYARLPKKAMMVKGSKKAKEGTEKEPDSDNAPRRISPLQSSNSNEGDAAEEEEESDFDLENDEESEDEEEISNSEKTSNPEDTTERGVTDRSPEEESGDNKITDEEADVEKDEESEEN